MDERTTRFRCPVDGCRVIYYNAAATCVGGWPIYDPQRPGARTPEHAAVRVEVDTQTVRR